VKNILGKTVKIVFVILHYKIVDDTIDCVESILKNERYSKYEIVVVENGSPGDDYDILQKEFSNNDVVHVMQTEENLGFAKGNNVGFQYAKKILKADFIILLNNDTIIKQKEFLNKVIYIYEKTRCAILGPDILSMDDGEHQNPHQKVNLQNVKSNIIFYKTCLILTHLNLYEPITKTIQFVLGLIKYKKNFAEDIYWRDIQEGVKLYGACLIFSPEYVSKFNGLYDKTFMYVEEDILYYIAQREKLKMVYSPEISNMCNSLKVFLQLKKNYDNETITLIDEYD